MLREKRIPVWMAMSFFRGVTEETNDIISLMSRVVPVWGRGSDWRLCTRPQPEWDEALPAEINRLESQVSTGASPYGQFLKKKWWKQDAAWFEMWYFSSVTIYHLISLIIQEKKWGAEATTRHYSIISWNNVQPQWTPITAWQYQHQDIRKPCRKFLHFNSSGEIL